MLKTLILKNLILIDSCEIDFSKGLTIISGETGTGKTAITQGIALCLGQRADSSFVRKGEDKATIEAAFEVNAMPLVEGFDPSELLVIRREISKEGKSRAFVNGQMVNLAFLQKLSMHLVDLVNQHAHMNFNEREAIDLYGELAGDIQLFQEAWEAEKKVQEQLSAVELVDVALERELCTHQIDELEKAQYKEGEEDQIFEEYQKIAENTELSQKLNGIDIDTPLSTISRYKNIVPNEIADLLQEALIPLQEASQAVSRILSQIDVDPAHFAYLEHRLSLLDKLKKKYGKDIAAVKHRLEKRLQQLDNIEFDRDALILLLNSLKQKTGELAKLLSQKRAQTAQKLAIELTKNLHELNMPNAELTIQVSTQERGSTGEDFIAFFLKANKGESAVSVKERSSGGELCRILLALKTVLAEKNNTPTILFDEVDANIGGTTASLMADKLSLLGQKRQVICITHFPQVAIKADHHLMVLKEEIGGRTVTLVETLRGSEREKEIVRMLGGSSAFASENQKEPFTVLK